MRGLRFGALAFWVALLGLVTTALAVNPQYPGKPAFVTGGTASVVAFGPYSDPGLAPTALSMWSSDGQPFRVRLFFDGEGSNPDAFEAASWEVPQSFLEAAPAPIDTTGGWYVYLAIAAPEVAATDSVIVKPYFGGVNK